jgi:hypothetical protein
MMTNAVFFLDTYLSPTQLVVVVIAGAIAALVASAISRATCEVHKTRLLMEEMQRDIRKLVMLQQMSRSEANNPPREFAGSPPQAGVPLPDVSAKDA